MEENMRLQQENDTLAHEIVVTKVGMQERITEVGYLWLFPHNTGNIFKLWKYDFSKF